ncbi:MAG: hypothetical protein J0I20_00980 [Chloroflexi bacterium]|nr:hypothetical protein [Chloroflexota bacterium]OJV89634.1 MAG: hypothetical protein BGO39_37395 [Chloroflexi bacterium 54-19]
MDTYRSKPDKEKDFENGYAYQSPELPATNPASSKLGNNSFGYSLLKALRLSSQTHVSADCDGTTAASEVEGGAEFAGFVNTRSYVEQTPVYRGEYKSLSPLYFNTEPVDNANDTSLDRAKLSSYSRAQLFFLLRLERFLRLRQHWLQASPRADEQWKTELVMRGIFSALQDCITHGVGEDGKQLLARWKCC